MHLFWAAAAHRENRCSLAQIPLRAVPGSHVPPHMHTYRAATIHRRDTLFSREYNIINLAVLYYAYRYTWLMINNDFYRPWKIAAVVFLEFPARPAGRGCVRAREFFSIYVFDHTRANAYPRPENLFQHGRRWRWRSRWRYANICTRQSGRRQKCFF